MSGFLNFAQSHGLVIQSLESGRWVRVPTTDHPRKRNGAYFYAGDYGHVQNWAEMTDCESWREDKPMTPRDTELLRARMEASQKKYAADRARKQEKAAKKAAWILGQCELEQHAYLDGKGFPEMRGNVWRKDGQAPLLVVPMFYGGLCGCQLISIYGDKKFLTGQRTNDSTFSIGNGSQIYLVEGYVSGLSLHTLLSALKMPHTVLVTFSAGNLARLAKARPRAWIIADNDASGTGQRVAEESGCRWWTPEAVGADVNDLHKELGTFKASQILRKALR